MEHPAGGYEADDFDMGSLPDGTEEVDKRLQGIIDKLNELKSSLVKGFWDGLGDTAVFDDIQKHIDGIRISLIDIVTDSDIQKAAEEFANTFAYNLGRVSGSVASIGLTIADNLLGGIDLYLQQNARRIKEYLISMFNIGGEISQIAGDFSSAVAEIFSAFRSDSAKQIYRGYYWYFQFIFPRYHGAWWKVRERYPGTDHKANNGQCRSN